jgi:hypothetical protein
MVLKPEASERGMICPSPIPLSPSKRIWAGGVGVAVGVWVGVALGVLVGVAVAVGVALGVGVAVTVAVEAGS